MVEATHDSPPGGRHGTSRSFIGAIAVIGLMAAVNLAAFAAVRDAGHHLESQTGDELAAREVRFDAANMNGDQNRYVLEGGAGRGRFLRDADRFEAALGAARRAQRSPQERRLLASIAGRYRNFRALDDRVAAALAAGRPDRARALAFGPETAIYERMADDAAGLERLAAADHRSALSSYDRTQQLALAVLLVLDVAAAALVVALLAERRHTGRMLDASTERYRTLVEQLPAATFIMDATGTPTYVSPQIEGILGRSPEELRTDGATPEGREPWFHPDDLDRMHQHVAGVYNGGADGYDFRARMLRQDGSVRHLHAIASARRAADGTLTAVQGILMDVTGEVLAQEQADADRRRYQALVEQIPVITYVTTPTGEITYVSPQIERILGYGEADYAEPGSIEQRLPELLDPDAVDHVAEQMAALFAGDVDDVDVTTQMLARGGETRYVQIIARAVRDGDGRVIDTQGVVVDQTALHLSEERRTDALRALVTAGEDVQRRIAGELHDDTIQVLTAVVLQLRRYARRVPELEETAGILAAALERTRRLMFELRPEVLERDGLGAALRAVAGDGPWQEAVVDVQVPRQVAATEALVYRAVRELVVNARKHSRAAHLAIGGRADERLLHFEVTDDGIGFDPDAATDRERMARHIGLHSTIERIRLAGGEVTIDAAPGRGATFRLAVPADPRDG